MSKHIRVQRLTMARSTKAADAAQTPRLEVPDVIAFVTSPEYLNRPQLYPLQALLLKVIFLAVDLFSDRDREVLARWGAGFIPAGEPGSRHFQGSEGMPPDVLARIDACRAQGRRWFREVVLVMGRRGSKGYVTALATAYVVWHYLALDDPQGHCCIKRSPQGVAARSPIHRLEPRPTPPWSGHWRLAPGLEESLASRYTGNLPEDTKH